MGIEKRNRLFIDNKKIQRELNQSPSRWGKGESTSVRKHSLVPNEYWIHWQVIWRRF